MTSVSPTSGLLVPRCESDSAGRLIRVEYGVSRVPYTLTNWVTRESVVVNVCLVTQSGTHH